MDEQNNLQRDLTEEEKKNPVSSGAVEWHDPLDKPVYEHDHPTGKLAIASLLLSIAGICMVCVPAAAAIMGTAALICGIISRVRHEDAKTPATVGIVLGGIALGTALVLSLMRTAYENGGNTVNDYYNDVYEDIVNQ